jgi:hypothetical protein
VKFIGTDSVIVKDCRGIGRMCVTCTVDIIDYSVCGGCKGGRGSGGKCWGGEEGKEKKGKGERRKTKKKGKKKKKEKGEEKGKWSKGGLSKLIFEQSGRGT